MSPEARERVRFYGRLPSNKIEPLRRRCFLTLVFSRYETFGNVCMEALAQGSPLVATNTGGIPEIVRHDENGLLAEPDDLDDLTAKVQLLLDRPDLAARLGQAGWEDSRTRFNPMTLATQTVAFYQSVLDQRHAPIGKTG
jgi:glycosyltransferase involved in cell wall biosynthesis